MKRTAIFNEGINSNRNWWENLEAYHNDHSPTKTGLLLPGIFGEDLITWCRITPEWLDSNPRSEAMSQQHPHYYETVAASAMLGIINMSRMDVPSGTPHSVIGTTASRRVGNSSIEVWDDFATTTGGWTNSACASCIENVLMTWNQSIGGETGCLRAELVDGGTSWYQITYGNVGLAGYQKKVHMRVYHPDGNQMDGFDFQSQDLNHTLRYWGTYNTHTQPLDTWIEYDTDYIQAPADTELVITFRNATNRNENLSGNEYIYFKDIRISRHYARPLASPTIGNYGVYDATTVTPSGTRSIKLGVVDEYLLNYELDNLKNDTEGTWGFYFACKVSGGSGGEGAVLSLNDGGTTNYFDIWINNGVITVSDGTTNLTWGTAQWPSVNVFHTLIVVMDSVGDISVYYNDSQVGSPQAGVWHDHYNSGNSWTKCYNGGYRAHGSGVYEDILLSSVVYVNRECTGTEITDIHNEMKDASP